MRIKYSGRSLRIRDGSFFLLGIIIAVLIGATIILIRHAQTPVPYVKSGVNSPWVPSTVKHWNSTIDEMSRKYDIDPDLVAIIMTLESGGDAKAKSSVGAVGLMQVTPPTAKDIASKYLKQPVSSYNLQDPKTSIEFGTAYLAYLRNTFGESGQGPSWNSTVELIAASYNGGPLAAQHLRDGKGIHDSQTVVYSRDAFNMWRERHASDSPTFDRWKERGGSQLIEAAKADQ